jgi:hypothetical protein
MHRKHTHSLLSDLVQRTSSLWFTGPLILYMSNWTIYEVGCGRQVFVRMWLRNKAGPHYYLASYNISVHRASLRYYAHWASLRYPDTLSLTTVSMYTEPRYGIRVHRASLQYPHWASLRYSCPVSLLTVSRRSQPHCDSRVHWASLRYPDTLSHYGICVHWALLRYYIHWALLWYLCIQPRYGITHNKPRCSIRAYSLTTVLRTTRLAVVSVRTASLRYYAQRASLWYPCIQSWYGIPAYRASLWYRCIQPCYGIPAHRRFLLYP